MGKKYLDVKKDSLEESILNIWQTAAEEAGTKMDGRTRGYKSHRSKLESSKAKREEKKAANLKESVLNIWQTAAEGKSYEMGTDEYREYLERLTPGETIGEKKGDKEEYQKFFNSALKKFGVKSPAELKGDKKKEFFDYVDKNWTGDHEEAFEFAKEAKTASMKEAIAKVWNFSEKVQYVEYKFKNENDAKKAKAYFDKQQMISFELNDDNISGGELMVDAGKNDMTKHHKEIMKMLKPKVMTQEKVGGNKTLTGKKAAVVEIDPKPDLENGKKKKSGNPDH